MKIESEKVKEERRRCFIEEVNSKFGNKFDYSNVGLVDNLSIQKHLIKCLKHGDFFQTVVDHLNSRFGCGECGKENRNPPKTHKVTRPYKIRKDSWKLNSKTRICSGCGVEIRYVKRKSYNTAQKENRLCSICTVKRHRTKHFLPNKPWIKKCKGCGVEILYKSRSGYIRSSDTPRCKSCFDLYQREKMIEKMKLFNIFPSFNINACKTMDRINKMYGFEFQHALNGGEVVVQGYFLDGYDKLKNIVFEYDEPSHYNKTGILKKKDLHRQTEIINHLKKYPIEPKFIRYDEKRDRLYEITTGKEIIDYGKKAKIF